MNSKEQTLSTAITLFPHNSVRQVAQTVEAEKFFCTLSADHIFNSMAKPRKLRHAETHDFTQWKEAAHMWQEHRTF